MKEILKEIEEREQEIGSILTGIKKIL